MTVAIGRDTIVALSAIVWADGRVAKEEADNLRSAARQLGLTGDDLVAVERALVERVELAEVETVAMSRLTRLFTYAAAAWMAAVDGAATAEENEVLSLLGDRLGLSSVARERAVRAVRALEAKSPGSFDLLELRSRLSVGISTIGDE